MINNTVLNNELNKSVRQITGRVELYLDGTLVNTFSHNTNLISFDIERIGDENKFFGYGVCQKVNVKVIDRERIIKPTTAQHMRLYFNDVRTSPKFYITEVHRDEKTGEISITAYDKIYFLNNSTVSQLASSTSYTIKEFAQAVGSHSGMQVVFPIGNAFNTNYPNGANFDGTETLRDALDDVAEATSTIYYINHEDKIVFKQLNGEPVLTIDKSKYFDLSSKTNRRLVKIVHVTELGDNVGASLSETGSVQYIRNNAFWDLRDDIGTLVNQSLDRIGGFTINQFECKWRGNPLLEIGDRISIITKDNESVFSNVLNDTISYDGSLSENTEWSYENEEETEEDNPSDLGEVLTKTYARVDKVNKEITLLASEVSDNKSEISEIKQNVDNISLTIKSTVQEVVKGEIGSVSLNVYTIVLSNEAQTIAVNNDRFPLTNETFTTVVQVYEGSNVRTDYEIGDIASANGITVSKTNSRVDFAVSTSNALTADNGTFTIPITIDGKTFNKTFSWSCSKQGNAGVDGADGKALNIQASSQIFKSVGDTYEPSIITLTPKCENITFSKWQYSLDGTTWNDVVSGTHGLTLTDGDVVPTIYGEIVLSKTSSSIEKGSTDTFTVKLNQQPTNNQIVTLSVNNSNVSINKTSLTFTPSNYNTAQSVTISGATVGTSTIALSSPNVSSKSISVTVTEVSQDVTYGEIIISNSVLTINEGNTTTFTVRLATAPTSNQIVNVSVGSSSIATVSPNTLTFTPSNYSTNQTVTVNAIKDSTSYVDNSTQITLTSNNVESKTISLTVKNTDQNTGGDLGGDEDDDTYLTLENTSVRNLVPYISTYYIKPTVKTGEEIILNYFVTDYYGRSYTNNSNFYNYKIIVKRQGKSNIIARNVSAGDHSISLGSYDQEGTYHFSIIAIDQYGRKSHELFNYVRVRNADDIHTNVYDVTDSDLSLYSVTINNDKEEREYVTVSSANFEKIEYDSQKETVQSAIDNAYNNGSVSSGKYKVFIPMFGASSGTDYKGKTNGWKCLKVKYGSGFDATTFLNQCTTNRQNLQRLISEKANAGYNKIVLRQGTYMIDNTPIDIPNGITLDLNGSTIKMCPITGNGALMMRMTDCTDTHLCNGTIEGDYFAHDYAGSTSNSEWVSGVEMAGSCRYCSIHDLTIKNITGYGLQNSISSTSPNGNTFYGAIKVADLEQGDIDRETGQNISCSYRLRSGVSNISAYQGNSEFISMSIHLNYQGNEFSSWNYFMYFYDSGNNFIQAVSAYQYRQVKIPQNAYYVRIVILGERLKSDWNLHYQFFRVPTHCEFRDITIDNARCVGMAQGQMKDFLVQDCVITNSGQSSATCSYDAEDGWDGMQDVFFENFRIYDCPNNGFLTCAGHNFVINNMNSEAIYMWERMRWAVIKNSTFTNGCVIRGGGEANIVQHGVTRFYDNTVLAPDYVNYLFMNVAKNCTYTTAPRNGIMVDSSVDGNTVSRTVYNNDSNNQITDDIGKSTDNVDYDDTGSQNVPVSRVTLNKTSISLTLNGTEQLVATVFPTNASNQGVTWSSSDTNIASVSSSGLVTGKGSGSATITVRTDDGGYTATCSVQVTSSSGGGGSSSDSEVDANGLVIVKYPALQKPKPTTWCAMGDSITAGTGAGGSSYSYANVCANLAGITAIHNHGVAGSCICAGFNTALTDLGVETAFCNRFGEMSDDADLITVLGSINDHGIDVKIGSPTSTDKNDFYGALYVLITGLKQKYPNGRIVFITPFKVNGWDGVNMYRHTLKDFRNAIVTQCNRFQIEVVDLFPEEQFSWSTGLDQGWFVSYDYYHPTAKGHQAIASWLKDQLFEDGSSSGGGDGGGSTTIPVTGLNVSEWDVKLEVGQQKTLTYNVIPTNATNQTVHWSNTNSGVATISNTNSTITINAVGVGYTCITGTTAEGNFTYDIHVNVSQSSSGGDGGGGDSSETPYLNPASVSVNVGENAYVNLLGTTSKTISSAYVANGNAKISTYTTSYVLVQGVTSGTDYLNVILSDNSTLTANVTVTSNSSSGGGSDSSGGSTSSGISNPNDTALTQQYSSSHEATPNIANPPSGAYNWKYAPRINPDGSFPNSTWNAFGHWMTTYKIEEASYYDNVGLLLQNPKAWIWNTSTNSWDVLSSDFEWGSWYLEDFYDDGNGTISNSITWEKGVSGNHSTWVKIKQDSTTQGRCFHPWGYQKDWRSNSSWSNNGQPYIVTKVDFKLVKYDENGADNLDSAQLVVNSGGDWWSEVGATWKPDWSTNRDMCVGKYIKATRELKRAWATNLPSSWSHGLPTDDSGGSSSGDSTGGGGNTGGSSVVTPSEATMAVGSTQRFTLSSDTIDYTYFATGKCSVWSSGSNYVEIKAESVGKDYLNIVLSSGNSISVPITIIESESTLTISLEEDSITTYASITPKKLVISNTSDLFTSDVSNVVFKALATDNNYYDTMTIIKLTDLSDELKGLEGEVIKNQNAIASLQLNTDSINASVQRVEETFVSTVDGINTNINSLTEKVNATMTSEDVKIEIQKEMANGASKVSTSTGFTFDENGLKVSKSDSEMNTQITEDGMRIYKNDEVMLTANNQGVDAKNLHATTYLIIGENSRMEDFTCDGTKRTAVFWIGSDN